MFACTTRMYNALWPNKNHVRRLAAGPIKQANKSKMKKKTKLTNQFVLLYIFICF